MFKLGSRRWSVANNRFSVEDSFFAFFSFFSKVCLPSS